MKDDKGREHSKHMNTKFWLKTSREHTTWEDNKQDLK